MHEELLELYGDAFKAAAERLVEQCRPEFTRQVRDAFAANRNLPIAECKIPIIGSMRDVEYDPHAPRNQHWELEQAAVQALLARKWFEFEAPLWAQPSPLTQDEITDCSNRGGDRRSGMVGWYATQLRAMWWEYKNATPFEIACAWAVAPRHQRMIMAAGNGAGIAPSNPTPSPS